MFSLYLFQKPSLQISVVASAVLLCSAKDTFYVQQMNIKTKKRSNTHTACSPHSLHHCAKDVQVLISALLWDNLQRRVVLSYLIFGTAYWSHLPESISFLESLKMESKGCPETSVWKYQSTLRIIPEERRAHLRRGGGLKSRKNMLRLNVYNDFIQIT
jgi:hypothetical protein